jgi:HlyD family secretion protein
MQAATNLLPRIVREYILRKGLTGAVLAKQKEEAEARLRQTLLRQERSEMKSPVDGVILERLVRDEQFLASGTALLRIGERDRLEVEADILSEDVVRVREGAEVEIYGPAVGSAVGSGVPATVGRVYPTGFTKISSLGVEQQRVKVIIRFAGGVLESLREGRSLGVDYRVRVRIFTAEQQDATLLPRSALFRGPEGAWQVFAVRNGRAELQPVTIGLMNDEHAAVTAGLSAGDTVIVAPESDIKNDVRVHDQRTNQAGE